MCAALRARRGGARRGGAKCVAGKETAPGRLALPRRIPAFDEPELGWGSSATSRVPSRTGATTPTDSCARGWSRAARSCILSPRLTARRSLRRRRHRRRRGCARRASVPPASRQRTNARTSSSASGGRRVTVRSPARERPTSVCVSRLSRLSPWPGRHGMRRGALTSQGSPQASSCRWGAYPKRPASEQARAWPWVRISFPRRRTGFGWWGGSCAVPGCSP
jgi:hypothetical protein